MLRQQKSARSSSSGPEPPGPPAATSKSRSRSHGNGLKETAPIVPLIFAPAPPKGKRGARSRSAAPDMAELFGGETSVPPTEKRTRIRSKTPQAAPSKAAASASAPAADQGKPRAAPTKEMDTTEPAGKLLPPSQIRV